MEDVRGARGGWYSTGSSSCQTLFVGDSITEGIKLYDVMNNATVLASTGVNLDSLYTKDAITLSDGTKVRLRVLGDQGIHHPGVGGAEGLLVRQEAVHHVEYRQYTP